MCCIYENTNFESNSQPWVASSLNSIGCVVSTKIQILKAIHNLFLRISCFLFVVLYLRKYKFWKQFTTMAPLQQPEQMLCCIYENTNFESNSQLVGGIGAAFLCCVVSTKIQILKAIHNCCCYRVWYLDVVLYLRKYKFWKQFTTNRQLFLEFTGLCCIYENTNFESNSQPGNV